MKPYLAILLVIAISACEKTGDDLPGPPDPPKSISVDKSQILLDYLSWIDTITVETEGEWTVDVDQSSRGFSVLRLDSFPDKFITYAPERITDGKDRSATVVVRHKNITDTAAVYIAVTQLATPKDTMVFGGSGQDIFNALHTAGPTDRVAVGFSESSDGDGTGNHGAKDFWVVKFNEKGEKIWSKSFGGSQDDVATCIVGAYTREELSIYSSGYLIGGYTSSNDGDVTGNHGQKDAWLIKVDTLGNLVWKKTLGTTGDDQIVSMLNVTSTGTLVSGIKNNDQWLIKLNLNGDVEWEKTFGSSGIDFAGGVTETQDGYYFTGSGKLADGDVADKPTSSYDAWIVKINHAGETDWVRYISGAADEKGICIAGFYNTSVIVIGTTESNDIFPEFNGQRNIFAASYNAQGNLLWKKILKHTKWDEPSSVAYTKFGNLIIAGKSQNPESDATGEDSFDASLLVINQNGELLVSKMFGGPGPDGITGISSTGFNKPLVGYSSGGTTGMDLDGYFGWFDYR